LSTATNNHSSNGVAQLLVFGTEHGRKRPRAAWFIAAEATAARTAAQRLGLSVIALDSEERRVITTFLPKGRVLPDGRPLIPAVDPETLEHLRSWQNQSGGKPRGKPAGNRGRDRAARQLANTFWESLTVGSLVLAAEEDRDGKYLAGWWEAVVVAIRDDSVIFGWRDYADEGLYRRDRQHIAMLPLET
jgi:hypothetical protein